MAEKIEELRWNKAREEKMPIRFREEADHKGVEEQMRE